MSWTCPSCDRTFARNKQSHVCEPGLSLEEYFSTGPPWERPVFEAVNAHVQTLGPVIVEPVAIGIFFKRPKLFVELRPLSKWVRLGLALARSVDDPRITSKLGDGWYGIRLREPSDVDDQVRAWLTQSWDAGS